MVPIERALATGYTAVRYKALANVLKLAKSSKIGAVARQKVLVK